MNRLIIALLFVSAVGFVAAQEAPGTFEVASVKRNNAGAGNSMLRMLPGGRVSAQNFPVQRLITYAYDLALFQVIGGPGWLVNEGYDVIAKVEGNPRPVVPGTGQADPQKIA